MLLSLWSPPFAAPTPYMWLLVKCITSLNPPPTLLMDRPMILIWLVDQTINSSAHSVRVAQHALCNIMYSPSIFTRIISSAPRASENYSGEYPQACTLWYTYLLPRDPIMRSSCHTVSRGPINSIVLSIGLLDANTVHNILYVWPPHLYSYQIYM